MEREADTFSEGEIRMWSDCKSGSGSCGGGGGGGGAGGAAAETSDGQLKKMIRRLKELVANKNYTDAEIYDVLGECDMDADEAAQQLLSQDTFQEVKSKRKRRKERKATQESRAWEKNGVSLHGGRVGNGHAAVRSGSTQTNSDELGKAAYRRENGSVAPLPVSNSISHTSRGISNEQALYDSKQSIGKGNTISLPNQQTSGFQSNWPGAPSGHVSMGDIVRMGSRLNNRSSHLSSEAFYWLQDTAAPNSSQLHAKPPLGTSPTGPEPYKKIHSSHSSSVSEITAAQHGLDDEQPVIEPKIAASVLSSLDSSTTIDAKIRYNQGKSDMSGDNVAAENLCSDSFRSASESSRQLTVNATSGETNGDGHFRIGKNYKDDDRHINESHEGRSVTVSEDLKLSGAVTSLQYLSLGKDESRTSVAEGKCSVVLPDYVQDLEAVCSHLSFGTYRAGNGSAASGQLASGSTDDSSTVHFSSRALEDHRGEGLGSNSRCHNFPTGYCSALSSMNVPTTSLAKQSTTQALLGANSSTRHALPHHLPAHSYSDAANSSMPPGYNYIHSAQNTYTNNSFHPESNLFRESLSALKHNLLQQYRVSGNISSLSHLNHVASEYGGFVKGTSIPGSLLPNLTTASSRAKVGYEDALLSWYRNGNNFTLNPNDASAIWNHGFGSRKMSGVPDSTYYNLQRQNQRHARYEHHLTSSLQHYGTLGYPGICDSELGIALERLRRSFVDSNVSGFVRRSSNPSHQTGNSNF